MGTAHCLLKWEELVGASIKTEKFIFSIQELQSENKLWKITNGVHGYEFVSLAANEIANMFCCPKLKKDMWSCWLNFTANKQIAFKFH